MMTLQQTLAPMKLRPYGAIEMLLLICRIFTALHGMQTRSYDENSVRPSVCLSVCPFVPTVRRVNCDKTAERYV